jgi:hypothetical protein
VATRVDVEPLVGEDGTPVEPAELLSRFAAAGTALLGPDGAVLFHPVGRDDARGSTGAAVPVADQRGRLLGQLSLARPGGCPQEDLAEFGRFASAVADLAQQLRTARAANGNLTRALASNRQIGVAVGILATRNGLPAERAFEMLSRASQNTNRKVIDLADEVVLTGCLPGEQRIASHPRTGDTVREGGSSTV